jgi:hypothetical protein
VVAMTALGVALGAHPASAASVTVAQWHMDETSGSVMADSVGANHGTLHSVAVGRPGFAGTAYEFNGRSSYVSVPSNANLNPGSRNVTVTIRMNTTRRPTGTGDFDLIRKGYYSSAGGEWKVEYQPSGKATCGFKGSRGYAELTAGPSVSNGAWHTITCAKTASLVRLTVDGASFTKNAAVGSISNSNPVIVGAYPGAEFFPGRLDEAVIAYG